MIPDADRRCLADRVLEADDPWHDDPRVVVLDERRPDGHESRYFTAPARLAARLRQDDPMRIVYAPLSARPHLATPNR
jgi:hypothetical protein